MNIFVYYISQKKTLQSEQRILVYGFQRLIAHEEKRSETNYRVWKSFR